ncbi:hypothetical protein ACPUEK_15945 [Marinomonas gallaica]|uniref:hypothetical protein n=1 Tax=Marinomonas gallaica TaxID=1806667 RepID=UPI003CE4F4CA
MSRKVIAIHQQEGIELIFYDLPMGETIYVADNKIEAFSFVDFDEGKIKKGIILVLSSGVPAHIYFSNEAMGEYHRIKRELEEIFDLEK